jgi:putative phosphoesterase
VRLGIVSDAHCNAAALCVAIELLRPQVDGMLFAGDAVLQYRFSNEVLELIQAEDMRYVQGNHEMTLLQHGKPATSRPEVRRRNLEFMTAAPRRLRMKVGSGKTLLMVHACPFPPYDQYLYPTHPLLDRCAETEADFVVLGHTHVAMSARVGSTLVVNPGALGERSDPDHPGMVSCGVLDTDTEEFEVHRFADPARRATA